MSFIGDVLISFRLIAALKNSLPDSTIQFITTPVMADTAEAVEQIDDIIVFDKKGKHKGRQGYLHIVDEVNRFRPSHYFNLHPGYRAALIASKIINMPNGNKYRYNNAAGNFLYKGIDIVYGKGLHEIDRLRKFYNEISPLEFKDDVRICFTEMLQASIHRDLGIDAKDRSGYIVLFPGSVWATKKWGRDNYTQLAKRFLDKGEKVFIAGGPNEKLETAQIAADSGAINLGGSYTILETLYIVSLAKQVFANDSAPTHMANLTGTPVTTIFGPTHPMFGFYPIGKHDRVLHLDLKCSPCSIHGTNICPLGHHKCMHGISVDMVADTLTENI